MRSSLPAVLAGALAAVASAAQAQPVVVVNTSHAKTASKATVPCPDTITVSATQPGAVARFIVRGAVDGVVLIASQVRTLSTGRDGAELVASTPAQLIVPQKSVQLVLVPVDAANGIQIDRAGRDGTGRTVYLHAQGNQVALSRDGGTALRVVADRVSLRDHP